MPMKRLFDVRYERGLSYAEGVRLQEEAVRRGRMTLAELLEELITDESARKHFLVASGVRPPEPKQEESSSSW